MDKLINYINSHPEFGVKAFYSTPSIYIEMVHAESEEKGIVWDVKTDDFFPYADYPHAYWTGYFTSRPALKGTFLYSFRFSLPIIICAHT